MSELIEKHGARFLMAIVFVCGFGLIGGSLLNPILYQRAENWRDAITLVEGILLAGASLAMLFYSVMPKDRKERVWRKKNTGVGRMILSTRFVRIQLASRRRRG